MAGLFFGKQIGVFVFSWVSIKLRFVKLPKGSNWIQFYGVSVLTGIGFTMSLFVDSLAFDNETMFQHADRLAILLASFASGLFGYLILRFSQGGANQELRYEEAKEEIPESEYSEATAH
jgi:NhaA family Na+:H+ antiporter